MKNPMKKIICAGIGLLAASLFAEKVRLEVLVLDGDTDKPVEGAEVLAIFEGLSSYDATRKYAETDADGRCSLKGKSKNGVVSVCAELPDTYESSEELRYKEAVDGVFVPDHLVVTARVYKIGRNAPMLESDLRAWFSDIKGDDPDLLSYDILARSFLPPMGTGVVADVELRRFPVVQTGVIPSHEDENGMCHSEVTTYRGRYVIRFPGKGNGVHPIQKLPGVISSHAFRPAPEGDYDNELDCEGGVDEKTGKRIKPPNFSLLAIRIRSQYDDDGNLISCHYGRFWSDAFVNVQPSEITNAQLCWCVNVVPNDRNVEGSGDPFLSPQGVLEDYRRKHRAEGNEEK